MPKSCYIAERNGEVRYSTGADITPLPDGCQQLFTPMADVAPGLLDRILRVLRVENPSQAARKLGKAKQSVYDWDVKTPGLTTLIEIAESANTSLDFLVRDKGEAEPYGFLGETEQSIIQRMADDYGKSFEEILAGLVTSALVARGAELFGQHETIRSPEREQLQMMFKLYDQKEPESKVTAKKKTQPA